ncbi:MAG: cytochrome P450 [Bacillota bacterium]
MSLPLPPWSIAQFDPRSPAFAADPYPYYARLRAADPLLYLPAVRRWWVTSYPLAVQVLQDRRFVWRATAEPGADLLPDQAHLTGLPDSPMAMDPPDHARLRMLVSKALTPRVMESLRSQIAAVAGELIDRAEPAGRMELMADFALPLLDRLAETAAQRRGEPGPGFGGQLIRAVEEGRPLSGGELPATSLLLLAAGRQIITHLLGTGSLLLLQHPEQLALLRSRPDLITTAMEELLRLASPLQRFGLQATEDLELGGRAIRQGELLSVVVAAANRDPAVFPEPDRLDITRSPNPHLALGRGNHFCLGAPLVRLAAEIGLLTLLERLPGLALDGEPRWQPSTVVRGLQALPVRF